MGSYVERGRTFLSLICGSFGRVPDRNLTSSFSFHLIYACYPLFFSLAPPPPPPVSLLQVGQVHTTCMQEGQSRINLVTLCPGMMQEVTIGIDRRQGKRRCLPVSVKEKQKKQKERKKRRTHQGRIPLFTLKMCVIGIPSHNIVGPFFFKQLSLRYDDLDPSLFSPALSIYADIEEFLAGGGDRDYIITLIQHMYDFRVLTCCFCEPWINFYKWMEWEGKY